MATSTAPSDPDAQSRAQEDNDTLAESGSTSSGFALFWAALMILTFAVSVFFMFRAALQM